MTTKNKTHKLQGGAYTQPSLLRHIKACGLESAAKSILGTKKEQGTKLRGGGQERLPRERSSPENGVLKDEKDGTQDTERDERESATNVWKIWCGWSTELRGDHVTLGKILR